MHTKILLCSLKSAINSTIDSSYGHMIRAFFITFLSFHISPFDTNFTKSPLDLVICL
nr:MAG TPA: hypothetical protein [Caudoviricetes sp.]